MVITTTPHVEGKKVAQYHGIVAGEAILGANFIKDMFAGFRDVFGGRSGAYEAELGKARDAAHEELVQAASATGANAVIGCDVDYEVISRGNSSMLLVSISGTAVTVE